VGELPMRVVIPSFILSELRRAFEMGFLIFVPFLIIDFIVASTLMSMGMMMMPPVVISLPFKILLFVLVDGWTLVVKSLVLSFNM
jgi:flagellar biosynthetic protein FliP